MENPCRYSWITSPTCIATARPCLAASTARPMQLGGVTACLQMEQMRAASTSSASFSPGVLACITFLDHSVFLTLAFCWRVPSFLRWWLASLNLSAQFQPHTLLAFGCSEQVLQGYHHFMGYRLPSFYGLWVTIILWHRSVEGRDVDLITITDCFGASSEHESMPPAPYR